MERSKQSFGTRISTFNYHSKRRQVLERQLLSHGPCHHVIIGAIPVILTNRINFLPVTSGSVITGDGQNDIDIAGEDQEHYESIS